jgi:beta-N-acetylhexosaminidase
MYTGSVRGKLHCQVLLALAAAVALGACRSAPARGAASRPPELFAGLPSITESPTAQAEAGWNAGPVRLSRAAETRRVRRVLRAMSLEQKIGQRFMCWVEGTQISEQSLELIRQSAAGVILYPWNVENLQQVRELTSSLQRAALAADPPIGLFIAVDQEGGRVAAFRARELSGLAPAFYWGGYADPRYVTAAAYLACREIRALGCNMNLAPVLDLYGQADTTIIGDRSFGADPQLVGRLGVAYLQGARQAGVISVAKHFPGHGGSTVDSHGQLPVVDLSEQTLMERDLLPFRMAVRAGAEALMTAHVLFPQLDPEYPATVSARILRGLLRKRLGFRGVIISDGISMGALSRNFSVSDSLALMFQAGLDLVLVHSRYDLVELKLEVLRLLHSGAVSEEQIEEGAERVLRLKLRYGLILKGAY